jgi:hypothetical protein
MRRRALLAALCALPLPAAAQRETRLPLPPPFVPPPEQRRWGEAAPVPNRGVEAPMARPVPGADAQPSLDPTVIKPREVGGSATLSQEHPARREERLFLEPAPGLRLRVPFTE